MLFSSVWTSVCGENMSWRDIVGVWLLNKKDLVDLIRCLVETNIIPETLVDKAWFSLRRKRKRKQAEPLMWHKKYQNVLRSLCLRLCHIKGSACLCLRLRRNENQA